MRKLAILVTLLIAGLFSISCAETKPPPTPAPTPPSISTPTPAPTAIDAAKLFATNCAVCHGEKRQGVSGLGPALTPISLAKLSDAEIGDTILKGRPNTVMAGFRGRLSTKEIDALIQFIKSISP